jgi:hypothetical protein
MTLHYVLKYLLTSDLLLNDSFISVVQTQSWTILSVIGTIRGVGKMKDLENDALLNKLWLQDYMWQKPEMKITIYGYTCPQ